MSEYTPLYRQTINKVEKLLNDNKEWVQRYEGYAKLIKITDEDNPIKEAKKQFHARRNLEIYLSVTEAKKASESKVSFDLRYRGQSIGTLDIKKDKRLLTLKTVTNQTDFCKYPEVRRGLEKSIEWDSKIASIFGKYFRESPERTTLGKKQEHYFESQLLAAFSKKTGHDKLLRHIQPIMLMGCRFQMPTPLGASKAKNNKITYSGPKGRGPDILARQGHGKGTYLTVIELKDESKKAEPPEKAMCQAIAYATFLRELLRTGTDAISKGWWELFGFKGAISKKLKIKVVVAMPVGEHNDTSFGEETLFFSDSDDSLELHYIYFDVDKERKITSVRETSLSPVKKR